MKRAMLVLVLLALQRSMPAANHGPVFGMATPTNSQGEWSFDEGVFGRAGVNGSEVSFRMLAGYGITPHLTLSFTLPVVAATASFPRRGFSRVMTSRRRLHGDFNIGPRESAPELKALHLEV